ncbi:ABC transporter substrate-binding protein [Paralcaligenes ureilyticus]|uniref:ABC-type nitrate/sulfonate/bicarbonate transport system substrate-binding protein n=1 Tax=Paralcaligenes ureilyticus TaxID=627131 RepID=A0A4R3LZW7_9BURK|nr:ABC transporter substrate-binding protein [Paralcaligenes ureilyticus]TCT06321.1 ABC-type nitrate/sulfonate/bicarbonate transport system substrate-binding protein [Paralcaligenes ureilyticus]
MKRIFTGKMKSRLAAILALGVAVAAGLGYGTANAASPTLQTIRVQYYPGVAFQQTLQVAKDKDFFARANVDVKLINTNSGPEGLAAVISGSLDLASTNIDTFLAAAARGAGVQAVAATTGPYFSVLLQSDLKRNHQGEDWIGVMKDLVGKRLGVTARGAGTETFYRALFSSAGLDPASATYVAIGQGATALSAFQAKRVDSIMAYQPLTERLLASGAVMGIDITNGKGPKEIAGLGATVVYFGMKKNLDSKREAIKSFVKGLNDAADWSKKPANLDDLAAVMKPHIPMNKVDNPEAMLKKMIERGLNATTLTAVSTQDLTRWVLLLDKHANMDLPKEAAFVKPLVW